MYLRSSFKNIRLYEYIEENLLKRLLRLQINQVSIHVAASMSILKRVVQITTATGIHSAFLKFTPLI